MPTVSILYQYSQIPQLLISCCVGIKQGSWTQSEQRRLRRDFEYQTQYLDTFCAC